MKVLVATGKSGAFLFLFFLITLVPIVSFTQTGTSASAPDRLTESEIIGGTFGVRDHGPESTPQAPPPPATPPTTSPQPQAQPAPTPTATKAKATLTGIRYWSNRDYTRVAIQFSGPVAFDRPVQLPSNPELGLPPRIFVDFPGASIDKSLPNLDAQAGCFTLQIGDGLLKSARAGQYRPDIVRVVLDIESIYRFNAFPMPGQSYQFVIDVYGLRMGRPLGQEPEPDDQAIANLLGDRPAAAPAPTPGSGCPPSPRSKKFLLVLDPGHGGSDPGAIGPTGLKEKDVTLGLALEVKRLLEAERNDVSVALTRSDDRALGLVERTAMANTLNAELFVSIHVNAARNKKARGVETYYLDNTTDRAALRLAAKENFVSEEELIDPKDTTNLILADLITQSKVQDSVPLAGTIQDKVIRGLGPKYPSVPNKGVKKAPFWVLTGATMPCALAELSFISHPAEEKLLKSPEYRAVLARGLTDGIKSYFDDYLAVTLKD